MSHPLLPPEKGIGGFANYAQRIYFILGIAVATGVGIGAGTYWGWWAYMWDIVLPIRVVGVLAVSASAFVLWYAFLYGSYYYLGWPQRNPLMPVKSVEDEVTESADDLRVHVYDMVDETICKLKFCNRGPTDTFVVQLDSVLGHYPDGWHTPKSVRWASFPADEKHEVISGQDQWLDVLQVEFERHPEKQVNDRVEITGVSLLTPSGPLKIPVRWAVHGKVLEEVHVWVTVVSVATGNKKMFDCFLTASVGHSAPVVSWFARPWR